jgi:hypothetical protein
VADTAVVGLSMPNTNSLPWVVAAAIEHGWSIVPVDIGKHALVEWAPLQSERASLHQVEEWHTRLHPAAWAVITGSISGVDVFDFDGFEGTETMRKYGVRPHVRTGSGGAHQYVAHPGFHVPTLNAKTKAALREVLPGTDIKGDGGYAIFCGRNQSGAYGRFRPLSEPDPWAGEIVGKLMKIIGEQEIARGTTISPTPPTERVSAGEILAVFLDRERSGAGRNDTGLDLACQLRDNGYSKDEAASILLRYAAAVKSTNTKGRHEPYTDAEALVTLRSAYSRPPRDPWAFSRARAQAGRPPEAAENPLHGARHASSLSTILFSEVSMKRINWLWPRRIARGKVNLIAGNPGLGKSQITASIAAVVSTGGLWPVDRTPCVPGDVLFLSAEDDPADTMRPRLEAAGANLGRVHVLNGVVAGYTGQGRPVYRGFNLERDIEALSVKLSELRDVAAVSSTLLRHTSAILTPTETRRYVGCLPLWRTWPRAATRRLFVFPI